MKIKEVHVSCSSCPHAPTDILFRHIKDIFLLLLFCVYPSVSSETTRSIQILRISIAIVVIWLPEIFNNSCTGWNCCNIKQLTCKYYYCCQWCSPPVPQHLCHVQRSSDHAASHWSLLKYPYYHVRNYCDTILLSCVTGPLFSKFTL